MGTDDGIADGLTWPMKIFRFEVDLGSEMQRVAFQEVYGMDAETQIIDDRKNNEPGFSAIKMVGIPKRGNITLKGGTYQNNSNSWNWQNEIMTNKIKRRTISIKLVDETGHVMMQWQLSNALILKITSTDLKSDRNEVIIDSLEIAHDGITITNEL